MLKQLVFTTSFGLISAVSWADSTPAADPADKTPEMIGQEKMRSLRKMMDVRSRLVDEIFVPSKFLQPSKHNDRTPTIEIVYTGDDWGWPVYAIAVYRGCLEQSAENITADCRKQWYAIQLSAPDVDSNRPRQRGSRLAGLITSKMRADPLLSFEAAISDSGIEWEMADLKTCDGAVNVIERFDDYLNATPQARSEFFLHADMVFIKINRFQYQLSLKSPAPLSSGKWAAELMETLKPCWKPATFPLPWNNAK